MFFKAEIVFVRILFPLLAGITIAYFCQNELALSVSSYILASVLAILIIAQIGYKKFNLYKFKTTISVATFFLFFVFGFWLTLYNTDFLNSGYFVKKDSRFLKLVINNEPQQKGDILRFEGNVKATQVQNIIEKTSGKILIALKLDSVEPIHLKYGDVVWIVANHEAVEPPYNPAEFNFKKFLASKNIYQQAFINQHEIRKISEKQGNFIIDFAYQLRQKQVSIYRKLIKNDEAFAVASTLILGYRSDLSKETLDAYSKTGTIHALSVSGMHVGMIYIVLNWILFLMDRKKNLKIAKFLLITVLIWYYSLITGLAPSILRSAIMLTALMLAKVLNRKPNNYNIVSATAFFILVYDPFLIWDVGFQLSFLAVYGLIYLHPKIYGWFYIRNKIADKLWETVAISLAAQITTFPLSIYYFHQFPIYFLLANLFIFIPITILMYVGLAILIFKAFWLAPIFEWLIIQVNTSLKWIAELPLASLSGIWINGWQLWILTFVTFLIVFALVNFNKKLLFIGICATLLFQLTSLKSFLQKRKQEKIIAYSLRKNYATAFINGKNCVLLTDLSYDDKNYQFFIKPSLDEMQIQHVSKISLEEDLNQSDFLKTGNQILFKNLNMLFIGQEFNYKKILSKNQFDVVQFQSNPKVKLSEVRDAIAMRKLWLNASNKDYLIKRYESEAKSLNLDVAVLKKNPAQIISLNDD